MTIYDTVSIYSGVSVPSGVMRLRQSAAGHPHHHHHVDKMSIITDDQADKQHQQQQQSSSTLPSYEIELPAELIASRKWDNSSFHHYRWLVLTLAAVGLGLTFILRLSITVSIVKMVNQTYVRLEEEFFDQPELLERLVHGINITQDEIERALDGVVSLDELRQETGEFAWNNFIQSLIVNSYYIGYALPQVFLSRLADIYGPNKPLLISQLVAIASTALMPTSAYYGWQYVAGLRFIIGLTTAASYPITLSLIDLWMPYFENTRALTLVQFVSGAFIMINPLMTSSLCSAFHWSWVSYITCFIGIAWLCLWLLLTANTPEECWLVSQRELRLILANRRYQKAPTPKPRSTSMGSSSQDSQRPIANQSESESDEPSVEHPPRPSPPWRQIFRSWTFYALAFTWICFDGTQVATLNLLPTYLRTVMEFGISDNGLAVFVVAFAGIIAFAWGGNLISYLTGPSCRWNGSRARQLTFGIAAIGASICWLLPSVTGHQYRVALFVVNKLLHPAIQLVLINTVMDQWSSFGLSGTMFSVYNSISNGCTVMFTWSAGYMLDATGGHESSWNCLFTFFGVANLVCICVYMSARPEKPLLDEPPLEFRLPEPEIIVNSKPLKSSLKPVPESDATVVDMSNANNSNFLVVGKSI